MLGDKKRQIQELQSKCSKLEQDNEIIRNMYKEMKTDMDKLSKVLNDKTIIDNRSALKEEQLNKFKDADGMYNYQAYKQKKMGLGGLSDERTK
jgi:methyl coenzyme M reductase alpha subunit